MPTEGGAATEARLTTGTAGIPASEGPARQRDHPHHPRGQDRELMRMAAPGDPAAANAALRAMTAGAPAPQHDENVPLRIMIVDDSAMQRRLIARLVEGWGHHVVEAASGEAALTHCQMAAVDLVISDWMMPGMSGPEFCRRFRKLDRAQYGYFILLTSKTDKGAVAEGLQGGADDFLSKPVSPVELRARLAAGARILCMERRLRDTNRLLSDTLEQLRRVHDSLDRDLVQARTFQQSLLRARVRPFRGGQVTLLLHPSGHVGGDLVGAFPVGARHMGLFAIDVSGHGVSAALMTARLAGLFSGESPASNIGMEPCAGGGFRPRSPAMVAARLNRMMLHELASEHYCTLFYAVLDIAAGEVCMVQAGHPHPLVQRAGGGIEVLGSGGLPIGLIDEAEHGEFTCRLAPGDRLLVVSDGVTESVTTDGDQLGEAGLADLLHRLWDVTGETFHEALLWHLATDAPGPDFADDVSSLLVEYARPEPRPEAPHPVRGDLADTDRP